MNKSSELVLSGSGIIAEETGSSYGGESRAEMSYDSAMSRSSYLRIDYSSLDINEKINEESDEKKEVPKFTMIFNKYNNNKLNMRPSGKNQDDARAKDKNASKYTMIFNKEVTIRPKTENNETSLSKTELKKGEDGSRTNLYITGSRTGIDNPMRVIEPELSPMKLNDAETLMTLYGRSNLFIPELTICSLMSETEEPLKSKKSYSGNDIKRKANDPGLRLYNSLTSLPKNKSSNRRTDNQLRNKIASLTSLETHPNKEAPRKHVSTMQERKLFRVRSLDLSESLSSSESDIDRSIGFQKGNSEESKKEAGAESPRKSDKSRGDAVRKADKESGCRKQVQWKSEVDVIYFESHQAADGDRSGEILGRVMEPLREECEQQRTGFYAKMVPLGSHLNDRWQSLLKI